MGIVESDRFSLDAANEGAFPPAQAKRAHAGEPAVVVTAAADCGVAAAAAARVSLGSSIARAARVSDEG